MLQKLKRLAHPLTAAIAAIVIGYGVVWAQPTGPITIQPDEARPVEGNLGCPVTYTSQDASHGTLHCGDAAEIHEGVPVCTGHMPTVWHPLVQRTPAGAITCTYGHEHHADPNSVSDVFGPPGAWFGASGQAVSYPWQTSSQLGLENNVKHEGYKWYVERDRACRPFWGPPNDGCLRAWRVQVHTMGHASDAVARYHSYSMELLVEHQGRQGIVRHGGHMDFGHLSLNAGGGHVCPPLTNNPETFTCGAAHHRETGAKNVPAPYTDADRGAAGWYGLHLVTSLTTTIEDWGPIDYTNPTKQLFYPADRRMNNSRGNLGTMAATLTQSWLAPHTTGGRVNLDGYTDQHGNPTTVCTAPGPKTDSNIVCSTLKIENAPAVLTLWNHSRQGDVQIYDFDVLSPTTGRSVIVFPN